MAIRRIRNDSPFDLVDGKRYVYAQLSDGSYGLVPEDEASNIIGVPVSELPTYELDLAVGSAGAESSVHPTPNGTAWANGAFTQITTAVQTLGEAVAGAADSIGQLGAVIQPHRLDRIVYVDKADDEQREIEDRRPRAIALGGLTAKDERHE